MRGGRCDYPKIWAETGHEYRACLSIWRAYEHLTMVQQHQLLEATATAICLPEKFDITGRGRQASLFLSEPEGIFHQGVCDQEIHR